MSTSPPRAQRARYWMSPEDECERVSLALRVGERLDADHWMVVGGPNSLAGQLGRLVEQRVFDAEWGGHSPQVMAEEYGPYETRSIFSVVVCERGAVGCARTVWSGDIDEPLKAEVDLGLVPAQFRDQLGLEEAYGARGLWEIATVALEREVRQSPVLGWTLGEMRYQEMCRAGDTPSIAIVATTFFRMMQSWGIDIEAIPGLEPVEYLGVTSRPALLLPGRQPNVRSSGLFATQTASLRSRIDRPLVSPSVVLDLRDPAKAEAGDGGDLSDGVG